jgi:predicted membrane-bound mannosyltransferase
MPFYYDWSRIFRNDMLIVYVGAVAVLFLFVVMMLNVAQQKNNGFI